VSDAHAGRRGACPGCNSPIDIPLAPAAAASQPPESPEQKRCPGCSQGLPAGAVICTSCGMDLRTGRRLAQQLGPALPEAVEVDTSLEDAVPIEVVSLFLPLAIVPYGTSVMLKPKEGSSQTHAWYANLGLMILTAVASAYLLIVLLTRSSANLVGYLLWNGGNFSPVQLVTSMFLHASIAHFLGNMVFLWVFGNALSMAAGIVWYPLIYLGLGICAGYVGHVLPAEAGQDIPCIGASGAIMGLNGLFLVLFGRSKVHMAAWFRLFWFTQPHVKIFAVRGVWAVLFFTAFDIAAIVLGWSGNVAHGVHLAGFVAGIVLALVLLLSGAVRSQGEDLLTWVSGGRWRQGGEGPRS
jgi:membrane associated rhomboid family serine protease